jgi:DNA-binding transcriptional LysR family regulator
MIAQDMVAVRLTPPFAAIMVATPGYLEAKGIPLRIADLAAHNCIGFRLITSGAVYAWELQEAGRDVAVTVGGTVRVTDPTYARELALAGVGIAYVFEPLVAGDQRDGRLIRVLPESAITEPGLFLYYPRRAAGTPKLRAFLEVAKAISYQD